MNCRAGFVWATPLHFNRFIEDCGIISELITPHMLSAPFYRPTLNCLIVPTGFANPAYSNLLPALRASSPRIRRFVENGGSLLVFGAATDKPDAYDWLPASVLAFPGPTELAERLRQNGFQDVTYRLLFGGICAIHLGTRAL